VKGAQTRVQSQPPAQPVRERDMTRLQLARRGGETRESRADHEQIDHGALRRRRTRRGNQRGVPAKTAS
jgi:hypothetical protein